MKLVIFDTVDSRNPFVIMRLTPKSEKKRKKMCSLAVVFEALSEIYKSATMATTGDAKAALPVAIYL